MKAHNVFKRGADCYMFDILAELGQWNINCETTISHK